MSGIKPADLLKLKEQAQSLTGWFNTTDAWLDTSEDSACAVVGHISDEGALYPVAVVDCDQYDAPSDSIKLAKFYASANPKAILELIAAYEALQKENAELKEAIKKQSNAVNAFYAARSTEDKNRDEEIIRLRSLDADNKGLKECNAILTEENVSQAKKIEEMLKANK